jgi:putative ABC transport system permease protein
MKPYPPQLLLRFFRWFCHPELRDHIEGDLMELYDERVNQSGKRRADAGFMFDVLLLFRPGIIRPPKGLKDLNTYPMYKSYFKIAFRSLLSKKIYSSINIIGLSIGMTCCLLIFQYVDFEYSFDKFNSNAKIYRVIEKSTQGGETETKATFGWALGPALGQEVPEVASYVRLHPDYDNAVISNPSQPDKAFEEQWVYYADSTFFKVFSYPLVSGNPDHALAEPGTIMLSESAARKYFGDEDPIGQTLNVRGWISGSFRVDGIFRDVPANSHLKFDILLPMADLLEKSRFKESWTAWDWENFITYVQLHAKADPKAAEQKFTDVFIKNKQESLRRTGTTAQIYAQPLRDIHLNEDITVAKTVMGSYRTVYFFTVIGLITLLIALANYINLTTARALDRAREVGVRKVIGAKRGQLITQFAAEFALTTLIAFTLAAVLAEGFKPFVNNVAGIHLISGLWKDPDFWLTVSIIFFATTFLAGLYPSFVLSSFKPVAVLKGKISASSNSGWLRQGLVVLQFTASIALLVGTAIVYMQLNYMRNMDLGIDLQQILTVSAPRVLPEDVGRASAVDNFIHEVSRLPAVLKTATSAALPGEEFSWTTSTVKRVADGSFNVPGAVTYIDTSFATLYGVELSAGNGFKHVPISAADQKPYPIIANETAINALGFESPEKALDQEIDIADGNICRIVGVFKDFNWSSAHQERENSFYFLRHGLSKISLKVGTENLSGTLSSIEEIYKKLFPGNPFLYAFEDASFATQYQNDQRFARLFGIFAALAVFIACLGLFGLVTFTARQRTKEIGVRKVLGATVPNVMALLSKDFIKLVTIGFLIAVPIAWYVMNRWLQGFAYRIEIGVGVFLLAGLTAVLIAMATVSWQSAKAAMVNPVDSLRNE